MMTASSANWADVSTTTPQVHAAGKMKVFLSAPSFIDISVYIPL